jgi:DNA invertase Pin-like site-specific DNA recombinase
MGRLTLNILLSFAQFEREVTAERIRDKIAASRAKGMWMGGTVPLGYEVKDRKLVVRETDAAIVRSIFERFLQIGSATVLARELRRDGVQSKRGNPIDKGSVYKLLNNRSISAWRCTRARPIPASTTRSSTRTCGTRCTRSSRRTPAPAPQTPGRRRRRC